MKQLLDTAAIMAVQTPAAATAFSGAGLYQYAIRLSEQFQDKVCHSTNSQFQQRLYPFLLNEQNKNNGTLPQLKQKPTCSITLLSPSSDPLQPLGPIWQVLMEAAYQLVCKAPHINQSCLQMVCCSYLDTNTQRACDKGSLANLKPLSCTVLG